jgi:hypothetical protein
MDRPARGDVNYRWRTPNRMVSTDGGREMLEGQRLAATRRASQPEVVSPAVVHVIVHENAYTSKRLLFRP